MSGLCHALTAHFSFAALSALKLELAQAISAKLRDEGGTQPTQLMASKWQVSMAQSLGQKGRTFDASLQKIGVFFRLDYNCIVTYCSLAHSLALSSESVS